jgi:hypothetical protein
MKIGAVLASFFEILQLDLSSPQVSQTQLLPRTEGSREKERKKVQKPRALYAGQMLSIGRSSHNRTLHRHINKHRMRSSSKSCVMRSSHDLASRRPDPIVYRGGLLLSNGVSRAPK